MKFSGYGLKTAAAAAAAAGVATLAAAPAQALSFGDRLTLAGESRLEITGSTAVLNFSDSPIGTLNYGTNAGTATVGGSSNAVFRSDAGGTLLAGPLYAKLKDLSLTSTGTDVWQLADSQVENFIEFGHNDISFDLTSFLLTRRTVDGLNFWRASLNGVFKSADIPGVGTFTTQGNFISDPGTTYSMATRVVPTPALLPGLLGMGVAALRKRKQENQEADA